MTAPRLGATPVTGEKRSLFKLIGDVPTLVRELIRTEIELAKTEMIAKLKSAGIGAGFLAGAAVVLILFLGVLLTSAVLAFAQIMPGWLAALLVAGIVLVIAAVLGFVGYLILKKGIPPVPSDTIENIKHDLDAITGVGKRDDSEHVRHPGTGNGYARGA